MVAYDLIWLLLWKWKTELFTHSIWRLPYLCQICVTLCFCIKTVDCRKALLTDDCISHTGGWTGELAPKNMADIFRPYYIVAWVVSPSYRKWVLHSSAALFSCISGRQAWMSSSGKVRQEIGYKVQMYAYKRSKQRLTPWRMSFLASPLGLMTLERCFSLLPKAWEWELLLLKKGCRSRVSNMVALPSLFLISCL